MVIDFSPLRRKEKTIKELAAGFSRRDLVQLANEMCDEMLARLDGAEDADATFVPVDEEANDTFAATTEEVGLSWTLGHVIVHATASAEEAAAHALTLARGVTTSERSRYEVPWEEATTAAFMRGRVEESRRMQLAMLEAWPDEPHLEVLYVRREGVPGTNAVERFVGGLFHSDSHLDQIGKVLEQARAARGVHA
jgi:hypothetical protein